MQPVCAQNTGVVSMITGIHVVKGEMREDNGTFYYSYNFDVQYQLYNPSSTTTNYKIEKECDGTSMYLVYEGNASEYMTTTCSRAKYDRVVPYGISEYNETKTIELTAKYYDGINETDPIHLLPGTYEFNVFASLGNGGSYTIIVTNNTSTQTSNDIPDNFPVNGIRSTSGEITKLNRLDISYIFWFPVILCVILIQQNMKKFSTRSDY